MEEYSLLDNKALIERLEKAGLADRLIDTQEWRLLKEAGKRIVDRAVDEFALRTNVQDLAKLSDLKAIIKKWKYGIFSELEMLKQDGEAAFSEAKNRDIIRMTNREESDDQES